jgi:hypothetical protein
MQTAGFVNDAAVIGLLALDGHLLASIAALLSIRELGGLALVCRRFSVSQTIAHSRPAVPGEPQRAPQYHSVVEEGVRLAVGARPQGERDSWPRQAGEPWLRVLAALLAGAV